MNTICIRSRLKKGSLNEVRAWFHTLKSRMNETLVTLENEGVIVESAFLDAHGEDYFLIYYMRAHDITHAYRVFEESNSPIDRYYKDCWTKYCEGREVLEELIDIHRVEAISL